MDSTSNEGQLQEFVQELDREFHEKEFQEVELFFLDTQARFESNEVLKELMQTESQTEAY